MTKLWKPTSAQCALIRACAAREAAPRVALANVVLEPGFRASTRVDAEPSINVALVAADRHYWGESTDLFDYGRWADFRAGVPLTEDGRAIVDFYIRLRGDEHRELLGNVVVHYGGGRITRIHGYARISDYPLPEE